MARQWIHQIDIDVELKMETSVEIQIEIEHQFSSQREQTEYISLR